MDVLVWISNEKRGGLSENLLLASLRLLAVISSGSCFFHLRLIGTEEIVPNMITATRMIQHGWYHGCIVVLRWFRIQKHGKQQKRDGWKDDGLAVRSLPQVGYVEVSWSVFILSTLKQLTTPSDFRTLLDFQAINCFFGLPSEDFFRNNKGVNYRKSHGLHPVFFFKDASQVFFSWTIVDDQMKGERSNQCLFQWHQAAWMSLNSLPDKMHIWHILDLGMIWRQHLKHMYAHKFGWIVGNSETWWSSLVSLVSLLSLLSWLVS